MKLSRRQKLLKLHRPWQCSLSILSYYPAQTCCMSGLLSAHIHSGANLRPLTLSCEHSALTPFKIHILFSPELIFFLARRPTPIPATQRSSAAPDDASPSPQPSSQ